MRRHFVRALGLRPGEDGRVLKKLDPGPAIGPLEDNVPMPRSKNYGGLRRKMEKMTPGQSFVTALSRTGCYSMANKLGFRINVRQETENTIRVWRLREDEDE